MDLRDLTGGWLRWSGKLGLIGQSVAAQQSAALTGVNAGMWADYMAALGDGAGAGATTSTTEALAGRGSYGSFGG